MVARFHAKVRSLPVLDPRRMACMEVAAREEGACVRTIFSTWPTAARRMLPDQWIVGACLCFGLRIPVLSTFVGATIGNTDRACDACGVELMTAQTGGDGFRHKNDAVNWCVEDIE